MKKNATMVKMMMALVMMTSAMGAASAMASSEISGKVSQDKAAAQTVNTSGQSDSSQAQSQGMREIVRVR